MYSKSTFKFKEVSSDVVTNADSIYDGNFTVICQRWLLELFTVDEVKNVLAVTDMAEGLFDPTVFSTPSVVERYASQKFTRFFSGTEDAAKEVYISLITNGDVEAFLEGQ